MTSYSINGEEISRRNFTYINKQKYTILNTKTGQKRI